MDERGPYRVFYMNKRIAIFEDRENALKYIDALTSHATARTSREDYEILDRSDA